MNQTSRPTLLHVVEQPTGASGDFDQACGQAGFDVEHVETVYGAMARLVRPKDHPVCAVIVCLDGLEPSELEFFTLAAKLAPTVPLYIYGEGPDGQRRHRALSLGARREVSADRIAEVLAALGQDQPAEGVEPPTDVSDEAAVSVVEVERPAAPRVDTLEDRQEFPPVAETQELEDVEEAHTMRPTTRPEHPHRSSRIPTPWEPVSNRPRRIPPEGRPTPRHDVGGSGSDASSESHRGATEPLLSRQEVDALLKESPLPDETGRTIQ